MKVLKYIINWTVWSLLALYLLLVISLRIPSVQQFLGTRAASVIANQLGTKVNIGRIDLGFFNRIIIDELSIYDQQQKEMLWAKRLSAKIDILALLQNRVDISSAQLFGARAMLYQATADSPANFQFALDSLASKDTTDSRPLDLRINSFIVRHSNVRYDQLDVAPTPGKLNTAHLRIDDISAHILLKVLREDSLNLNVKRLSLNEHSGLAIDQLSFKLLMNRQQAQLTSFVFQMPDTKLTMDSLKASYTISTTPAGPKIEHISYKGAVSDSYITPSDLRSFLPSLKNYQSKLNVAMDFNGTNQKLTLNKLTINSSHDDIDISGSGWADKLDGEPIWHAQIDNMTLSDKTIDFLTKGVGVPPILRRIGTLHLQGFFNGRVKGDTYAQATVSSDIGRLGIQGKVSADNAFKGNIIAQDINLNQLLEKEEFGLVAANVMMEGKLYSQQKPFIKADGIVSSFDYNGYRYSNINLNGTYSEAGIKGAIEIGDPNITAHLKGELTTLNSAKSTKQVIINGSIADFAPGITKLSDKWGDARFSGNILADFTASNLNDAQGNLDISNFRMDNYGFDKLHVTSGYIDHHHFVTLHSDFAEAQLTGQFDYTTLVQSIINFIGEKLPTLPGLPPTTRQTDNDFSLSLKVFKSDWLQHLFEIPLELDQPASLQASFNDRIRRVEIRGDMPAFKYKGTHYQTGNIHLSTPLDTMQCNMSVTKHNEDGGHFDIGLEARAINNELSTSIRWNNNDEEKTVSGVLNASTQLYKNLSNEAEAHIRILPSSITLGPSLWSIEPSDIIYSADRLSVDHFSVHHDDQHININGLASRHSQDELVVDLNKVEVDYILNLVDFHAVEFGGEATGQAVITSAFDDFAANGNIRVDNFTFEHGRMGTLFANVHWNQQEKQIDIDATANDGPDAMTYIKGYVSPSREYIDLGISARGSYLDFIHSFTKSFISHVTGHGQGDLRLAGPLSAINLTGQMVVDGEATITALNTTYQLRQDTVLFTHNEITLNRIPIYDRYNNIGYLSGGIHHIDLTSLTFDLNVEADNLLAYDFHDFGESTFYGTVFASGNVSIEGRPQRVTIDCRVTPQRNSVFTYNAAQTDAINNQEFITWRARQTAFSSPQGKASAYLGNGYEEPPVPPSSTDIIINFHVNTTPQATMRLLMDEKTNDYITLNGSGDIRATFHDKGAFNMYGTYTVDRGTYDVTIQNIIKKNFQFQQGGTIVFGGDPYDATLSLQALYTVNGVSLSDLNIGNSFSSNTIRVNCLMNIGGQPKAPQVTFDLDMPNVNSDEKQMVRSLLASQQEMNQQVLYLLGIGRFYNQGQNNAQAGQQDQTSLAMQSFLSGTLSTQINTVLSQIIKNDDWNFGANISTGTEGWNNAEYEGIINGRMLNNRLLINGQFGYRDNATRATPSFIGDFDIRYLLYPNGNLSLKVYNQTNDRYFTRSALNTQGIGIIMKKDFNGLQDFFSRKKRNHETANH